MAKKTNVRTLEPLIENRERMLAALRHRPCFGGLDLATSFDLNAYVLVFPWDGWAVLPWFWIPDDEMQKRARRDGVPYVEWVTAGFVETTDGEATDYARIRSRIRQISQDYWPHSIYFDPYQAHETAQRLSEAGLEMVSCGQRWNLSEASKRLEVLVKRRQLSHGGNPVLRWMAEHVGIKTNENGDIRPVKDHKSIYRVDGIVALVMAIAAALDHERPKQSVWESDDWSEPEDVDRADVREIERNRLSIYELSEDGGDDLAERGREIQQTRGARGSIWEMDGWTEEN